MGKIWLETFFCREIAGKKSLFSARLEVQEFRRHKCFGILTHAAFSLNGLHVVYCKICTIQCWYPTITNKHNRQDYKFTIFLCLYIHKPITKWKINVQHYKPKLDVQPELKLDMHSHKTLKNWNKTFIYINQYTNTKYTYNYMYLLWIDTYMQLGRGQCSAQES